MKGQEGVSSGRSQQQRARQVVDLVHVQQFINQMMVQVSCLQAQPAPSHRSHKFCEIQAVATIRTAAADAWFV